MTYPKNCSFCNDLVEHGYQGYAEKYGSVFYCKFCLKIGCVEVSDQFKMDYTRSYGLNDLDKQTQTYEEASVIKSEHKEKNGDYVIEMPRNIHVKNKKTITSFTNKMLTLLVIDITISIICILVLHNIICTIN